MINHGTGIIIGEQGIRGHREFLVLTNEHVADNHHIKGDSTLWIVEGEEVRTPIRLLIVAVDARRDQALLRTASCEDVLHVPAIAIGAPPEATEGANAFAQGYGNGKFSTLECRIAPGMTRKWGVRCYQLDVSVGGGQSGAPLIVLGENGRLYLTALVFCGDNQATEATPLYPEKACFATFRCVSTPIELIALATSSHVVQKTLHAV